MERPAIKTVLKYADKLEHHLAAVIDGTVQRLETTQPKLDVVETKIESWGIYNLFPLSPTSSLPSLIPGSVRYIWLITLNNESAVRQ